MTDPVATVSETPKPGYKTSEFWLSLSAMILGALLTSGVIVDSSPWAKLAGMLAAVLSALGYTVSRTIVKS